MNVIHYRTDADCISSCIPVKIQLKTHTEKSKNHGGQKRLSLYPHSIDDIYKWPCVRQDGSSVRSRRTGTIDTV